MLGRTQGCDLRRHVDNYVVFDLETTGVSPAKDKIIEISAIRVRDRMPVEEFSSLVNPECLIPPGASRVNHITNDMVAAAPGIQEILPDFLDFIGNDILVGHNIYAFDLKFIYKESRLIYQRIPGNDFVDTLSYARRKLPQLAHHRLGDLANYYGINPEGAHRALYDCRMNQQVFEYMSLESDH